VQHRSLVDAFVVKAGGVSVRVVGTLFSVGVGGDGAVSVRVVEGTVAVEAAGARALVHAGESWPPGSAALGAPERGAAGLPRALAGGGAERGAASGPVALAPIAPPPAPAAPARAVGSLRAPAGSSRAVGSLRAPAGSSRAVASLRALTAPARAVAPAPVTPARAAVPARTAPARALASAPVAPARAVGAAPAPVGPSPAAVSSPRRALVALPPEVTEVERPAPAASAGLTLYRSGEERRRAGDRAGSAAAFSAYVARYPDGPLVPEARLGLIEADLARGAYAEAAQAADAFLLAHPGSERRDEVALVRAHLARARGGCAEALSPYERLAGGAGATADDALYFAAACHQQLGHREEARRLLERSLARFPAGRHRAEVDRALRGAR
jgi:TolA-binding protein